MNTIQAAANVEYLFSLTSAYDPEITGTGGQPRGWDQWASIYRNYIVSGVAYKILIRPSSDSSTSTVALNSMVGITAGPENFSSDNFNAISDYMEYPKNKYHKWRITARNATVPSENQAYNSSPRWFKGFISNKKLLRYYGHKGMVANATNSATQYQYPEDFVAPINNDPNCEFEICIWAASLPQGGSSSLLALPHMHFDIQFTYYVTFYNPVYPAAS